MPVQENTINPTSASQRIDSSLAFFINPFLLFEKVTCLFVELSILRIAIFPLPIFSPRLHKRTFLSLLSAASGRSVNKRQDIDRSIQMLSLRLKRNSNKFLKNMSKIYNTHKNGGKQWTRANINKWKIVGN